MEDLPKAPEWKMQTISLNGYETAKPIVLFHRDPLEIIQALLRNPLFEGKWTFTARRVYQDLAQQNRIYGDWTTGNSAWSAQVSDQSTSAPSHLTTFISPLSHQVEHF